MTAIGDRPNDEWLASSGLLRQGRLVVDEAGRVRPDIVACGDVAVVRTPRGEQRVPLWSAAIDQKQGGRRCSDRRARRAGRRASLFLDPSSSACRSRRSGTCPSSASRRWSTAILARVVSPHWAASTVDDQAAAAINFRIPIPSCVDSASTRPEPGSIRHGLDAHYVKSMDIMLSE